MSSIGKFGKHTPRILRRQLIFQLIEQYLEEGEAISKINASFDADSDASNCKPSIQRFYGSLLFVDISGFTILSQKLGVEDLKNHINEYFTKMLDIVDKHGGDVVKFAGDALFIAWQVNHSTNSNEISTHQRQALLNHLEDNEFSRACKSAVEKAVACGTEIAVQCSNHKISLVSNTGNGVNGESGLTSPSTKPTGLLRRLLPTMFTAPLGGGASPNTSMPSGHRSSAPPVLSHSCVEEEEFAYLNVHAGVSTGLMAGIDIGTSERFEYFLIGEPLTKVAIAEGQAKLGDIVVCPETHALLHSAFRPTRQLSFFENIRGSLDFNSSGPNTNKAKRKVSSTSLRLNVNNTLLDILARDSSMRSVVVEDEHTCDCSRLEKGYYCLNTKQFTSKSFKHSKVKTKLLEHMHEDEDSATLDNRLVDQIESDIESVYNLYKTQFREKVVHYKEAYVMRAIQRAADKNNNRNNTTGTGGDGQDSLESSTSNVGGEMPLLELGVDEEQLKRSFQRWMQSCLTDDMARHVHNVARNEYIFKDSTRVSVLKNDLEHQFSKQRRTAIVTAPKSPGVTSPSLISTHGSNFNASVGSNITAGTQPPSPGPLRTSPNASPKLTPGGGQTIAQLRQIERPAHPGALQRQVSGVPGGGLQRQLSIKPGDFGVGPDGTVPLARGMTRGKSFSALNRQPSMNNLKRRQSSRKLLDLQDSSAMIAEIRNVTVLFISIDIPNMELLVDSNMKRSVRGTKGNLRGSMQASQKFAPMAEIRKMLSGKSQSSAQNSISNLVVNTADPSTSAIKFLMKTKNEVLSDKQLLDRMQACFEALQESFAEKGGQMRQFIVDDKGTVCIGTFGLRGSVSDDNAAAALETANMIVTKLSAIGLSSSIGVTVGKAYCGLVGSSKRHEYAVMGPSTNLSARLMGKAPPLKIICDYATRNSDRGHEFETLGDIIAKGYKEPVSTFSPIFQNIRKSLADNYIPMVSLLMAQTAQSDSSGHPNPESISKKLLSQGTGSTKIVRVQSRMSGEGQRSQDSLGSIGNFRDSHHPKVIQSLLRANFYLSNDHSALTTRDSMIDTGKVKIMTRLHGRRFEIETIISFLLSSLVDNSNPLGASTTRVPFGGSSAGAVTKSAGASGGGAGLAISHRQGVFSTSCKARYVGVFGSLGMGKSSLLNSISFHVYSVLKKHPNHNIQVFKTRMNSYNSTVPFSGWKSVIQEILVRVSRVFAMSGVESNRKKNTRRSFLVGVGVTSGVEQLIQGVDYLEPYLTKSQVLLARPLLTYLTIIPDSNEAAGTTILNHLSPQDKINSCGALLRAIIEAYPVVTKNLVFLTVENLESFDATSLTLFHEIYLFSAGIVVLFSSKPQSTLSFFDLLGDEAADDNDFGIGNPSDAKKRYLEIELSQLNKTATTAIVRDMLNRDNNSLINSDVEVDAETACKIYEVSKGNPMYVCELSRTLLQQQALMQQSSADQLMEGNTGSQRLLNELTTITAAGLTTNMHYNRIEEVICHRFDQLNTAAQTVLKMAAVASSNNSSFTFELLSFIINDENFGVSRQHPTGTTRSEKDNQFYFPQSLFTMFESNDQSLSTAVSNGTAGTTATENSLRNKQISDENLTNALYDIIMSEDFIQVTFLDDSSSAITTNIVTNTIHTSAKFHQTDPDAELAIPKAFITKELIAANCYEYHFAIALEAATMYNLLLEDQKQVIHECIAEYYESLRTMDVSELEEHQMEVSAKYGDSAGASSEDLQLGSQTVGKVRRDITAEHYSKEAYHWSQAYEWSSAMFCRYHAALLESEVNRNRVYWTSAFHMYKQMAATNTSHINGNLKTTTLSTTNNNVSEEGGMLLSSEELSQLCTIAILTDDPHQQKAELLALTTPEKSKGNRAGLKMTIKTDYLSTGLTNLDTVHTIYSGDNELLFVGITVQLREISRKLLEFTEPRGMQTMIEAVLQQLLLVRNPIKLCSDHVPWIDSTADSSTLHTQGTTNNNTNCNSVDGVSVGTPHNRRSYDHAHGGSHHTLHAAQKTASSLRISKSNSDEDQAAPGGVMHHRSVQQQETPFEDEYFHLQPFETLCWQTFSLFVENYLNFVTTSQDNHDKAAYLSELFLTETYLFSTTKDVLSRYSLVHKIQAMNLQCFVWFKTNKVSEALALCAQLQTLYSHELHSEALIFTYNTDRMSLLYTVAAQYCLLECNYDAAVRYVDTAAQLIRQTSHTATVAMCILPLCCTKTYIQRYQGAYNLLNSFLSTLEATRITNSLDSSSGTQDTVVDDIYKVHLEYFQRLVKYKEYQAERDPHIFNDDDPDIDLIVQQACMSDNVNNNSSNVNINSGPLSPTGSFNRLGSNNNFPKTPKNLSGASSPTSEPVSPIRARTDSNADNQENVNKHTVYNYLSLFGKSLESIFAEMCALKLTVLRDRHAEYTAMPAPKAIADSFRVYCNASLMYTRHILSAESDHTSQLLFNNTSTLVTAAQIYSIMLASPNLCKISSKIEAQCNHLLQHLTSKLAEPPGSVVNSGEDDKTKRGGSSRSSSAEKTYPTLILAVFKRQLQCHKAASPSVSMNTTLNTTLATLDRDVHDLLRAVKCSAGEEQYEKRLLTLLKTHLPFLSEAAWNTLQ